VSRPGPAGAEACGRHDVGVPVIAGYRRPVAIWVRLLRSEGRVRERAVPVVRVVQAVRSGAVRAALVTTSLWQRGGCNDIVVTSTSLGAAADAGRAGPESRPGTGERVRAGSATDGKH